jgi:outer membrane lipoprotein-sorting protein
MNRLLNRARSVQGVVVIGLFVANGLLAGGAAEGQPAAMTADDVVAKHLAAKGGVERLRAVDSVRSSGRIKTGRGVLEVTNWAKRPNMTRRELTVDGQTQVLAYDGKILWGINPLMSPKAQQITGPAADRTRQDAEDFDSVLLDYKDKGYKVDLVPGESSGTQGFRLRVTKKNGSVQDIHLNPETLLEDRITMEVTQEGKTAYIQTDFSNYQEVDGLMVPFTIRQTFNGQPQGEVVYDKVQFNVPIGDDLFRMPR